MSYVNSYLKMNNAADKILEGSYQRASSKGNSLVSRRGIPDLDDSELEPMGLSTGYLASIKDMFSEEENMESIKEYLGEKDTETETAVRPRSKADDFGVTDLSKMEGDWVEVSAKVLRDLEGFRDTPYYDVNAYRAGYGSDTYTTEDGAIKTVTKESFVSKEDAERDLYRRIKSEFGARAKQAAGDAWDAYNPLQKAALTSIAYNYGSIPERISDEVKTGDPKKVYEAILTLSDDNEGINKRRRMKEAEMMLYGVN